MDFDQLVTFLEVAKLGSFSRAGQKVFRSQSAVSAQIRQLEQEYGDRLLDRSGKDVTLTPAGRVLFAYAERLLQMRDESLLAVADQGTSPRGTLVIGANEATCLYVLPDVFAKYCHLYPGVQISIYRNFSYKIVEKLEVVPISEIAKQPLLLPKTGYSRRVMDKLFRPYASHLQVRMELPSVGMIKSFVAAGLGVSLISSSFARDQVLAGRVKLIPIKDEELWRELGIAYRRDRTHTRATSTFISTVRQLASASK